MKKLSLIMVLALVITAFTAMLVMNTSAETTPAPDADAPEEVTNPVANVGTDYLLYAFSSDDEAIKAGAIGRFTKAGGNGYAKTWKAVGGNSKDCGANVFYLITDVQTSGTMDLGGSGRPLTLDGSLGQLRTGDKAGVNYSVTSGSTVLAVTGGPNSVFTLKNVTLNYTGTADQVLSVPSQVKEPSKLGGKIVLDEGAKIVSGNMGILISDPKVNMTIKAGAEINAAGRAIQVHDNTYDVVVNVEGGTIYGGNTSYAVTLKGEKNTINVSGGTITADKVTSFGTVMLEGNGNHTLNVTGGTISGNKAGIYVHKNSAVNISGGTVLNSAAENDFGGVTAAEGTITIGAKDDAVAAAKDLEGKTDPAKKGTRGIVTGKNRAIVVKGAATVNVENGAYVHCVGNQALNYSAAGAKVNINGGHVEGNIVLATSQKGTLNITGGYVTKTGTADQGVVRGNANGVTINVSGNPTIDCGSTPFWYDQSTGGNADITINGGTFTANANIIKVTTSGKVNLKVTGGTFTGTKFIGLSSPAPSTIDISGGTFVASGEVIVLAGAPALDSAESAHTILNISGGSFKSTGSNVISISQSRTDIKEGDKVVGVKRAYTEVNISGGEFVTTAANKNVIYQPSDNAGKVTNITGGTFKAMNITNDLSAEGVVPGGTATTPAVGSVLWASGDKINVYGGEFYMYNGAEQPATQSTHAFTFGGGRVNIYGGNFYGGLFVTVQSGTSAWANITNKYAMPEDGDALLSVTTTKGASVRVDADLANSGIRFEGTIGEDVFDFITKYVAKATDTSKAYAGIAIVPADYLGENGTNGVFTFDALAAKNLTAATTKATKGLVDNKNGTYTLRLSLVNIRESNYDRDFVAIAYVAYENADGSLSVIYAPETSGERSIEFVAKSALADVKPNETVAPNGRVYNTPVTEKFDLDQDKFVAAEAGMASKYNLAQIDLLKAYITVKE